MNSLPAHCISKVWWLVQRFGLAGVTHRRPYNWRHLANTSIRCPEMSDRSVGNSIQIRVVCANSIPAFCIAIQNPEQLVQISKTAHWPSRFARASLRSSAMTTRSGPSFTLTMRSPRRSPPSPWSRASTTSSMKTHCRLRCGCVEELVTKGIGPEVESLSGLGGRHPRRFAEICHECGDA